MAQELVPVTKSVPATINGKIYDILSEAVLKKTMMYIQKYETEAVAIVLNESLFAIRDMCIEVEHLNLRKTSYKFQLIKDLLKHHISQVSSIALKINRSRQQPILNDNNKKAVLEIEQALVEIFGETSGVSLAQITPLLLAASNSEK